MTGWNRNYLIVGYKSARSMCGRMQQNSSRISKQCPDLMAVIADFSFRRCTDQF